MIIFDDDELRKRTTRKFTGTRLSIVGRASSHDCLICGQEAYHWHHYLGYSEEHLYDVIPLCTQCHVLVDRVILLRDPERANKAFRKRPLATPYSEAIALIMERLQRKATNPYIRKQSVNKEHKQS